MAAGDVKRGAAVAGSIALTGALSVNAGAVPALSLTTTHNDAIQLSGAGSAPFTIVDNASRGLRYYQGSERLRIDSSGRLSIGGATANTSSQIDLQTTTGAMLMPRLTTAQRDALTATNGMVIYNTSTNAVQGRVGGAWVNL